MYPPICKRAAPNAGMAGSKFLEILRCLRWNSVYCLLALHLIVKKQNCYHLTGKTSFFFRPM